MTSALRRHNKATPAPAERAADVAATEEVAQPLHYDTPTVALVVIAMLLAVFALRTGAAFFIPFVVSIILSYALSSAVNRLERWRVRGRQVRRL